MDLVFDASPEDLKVFIQEAEELIQQLDGNILRLEKEGHDPELVQEIFRAAHTLKGSSGMLGHERMAELTHAVETLFDKLRKNEMVITTELVDLLLNCVDALKALKDECVTLKASDVEVGVLCQKIQAFSNGTSQGHEVKENPLALSLDQDEMHTINRAEIAGQQAFLVSVSVASDCPMPSVRLYQVVEELQSLGKIIKSNPDIKTIESGDCGFSAEVVFVSSEDQTRIESVIKAISELSACTIRPYQMGTMQEKDSDAETSDEAVVDERVADLGPAARGKSPQEIKQMKSSAVKTVRVDVERLDHLMNLVGELVIGKTRLLQIGAELADNGRYDEISGTLNEVTAQIGQITNELQEEVMRARMLPIEQVFNKFPRLVRDLARNTGKEINFVIKGQETEIDRSVLEEISDPLIHILRNAIDHGIELPNERKKAGKPAQGNIYLCARNEENYIVVEVIDDGRGMDPQKLRQKAIRRGFITPEAAEKMSDRDAFELIFLSGFSTAECVSEISGRGVGMDVVRNNIKKINGSVEIESEPGKGTKFIIKLPLTLVIVDALIVVLNGKLYAIPLGVVKEVLRLNPGDIKMVDKLETVVLRGNILPLLRLSELFDQAQVADRSQDDDLHVVVVGYGENRVGLIVNRLVSKMEIMIKSLGDYLGDVEGISGATILGDGKVALVIDPVSLIVKVDTQRALSNQASKPERIRTLKTA